MKLAEIRRLYDENYAASYDGKFLLSEQARPDTDFEEALLSKMLEQGGPWLDLACGTGYFLSRFPHVERVGLDISPAMLARARSANPGVTLWERNFLDAAPEWQDRWKVVSCMWYAYGLVDSPRQVFDVIRNMALWTHPEGTAFLPTADPCLISGVELPTEKTVLFSPGTILLTGLTWSYIEGPNEEHVNMVALQVPVLIEAFERYFTNVEYARYPSTRGAIVASGKRRPE